MDTNEIRKIQYRLEEIRKTIFNETQKQFAKRVGVSIDVYKNNVNHSKHPNNIGTKFLPKVAERTGISLSYLKCKTDDPKENVPGEASLPINFSKTGEQLAELNEVLNSNCKLLNALHFLLSELPPKHSKTYEDMIISIYEAASQLSFQKNPKLLNNESFKLVEDYIFMNNMHEWKRVLLECEGDKALSKKKYREALSKYIQSLLVTGFESPTVNTNTPIRKISFAFPTNNRVKEKILGLINSWKGFEKCKSLKDYEIEVINQIKDLYV